MFGAAWLKLGAGFVLLAALAAGALYLHHQGAMAERAKLEPVLTRQAQTIADLNAAATRNLASIHTLEQANQDCADKYTRSLDATKAVADAERQHAKSLQQQLNRLYATQPKIKALAETPMPPDVAAKFNQQP